MEAALAVARAGLTADPVVPPPAALRPYLTFAKQTPRSLDAVARVVEADDDFRSRVAAAVDEDAVGRAGWLWLTRPEGWDDELAALEADSSARAADAAEQRKERAATRRLAATEAALARAERVAAALAADAEGRRADLAAEQAARLGAESRLVEAAAEAERLATERRDAVRNLKDTEVRLVERGTQLNAARARIRALEAELRAAASDADLERAGASPPEPPAGSAPAPSTSAGPPPSVASPGETPPPLRPVPAPPGAPPPVAVPAVVVTGVAHAAAAAAALADALAEVAEALEQAREDARGTPPAGAAAAATDEVPPAGAAAAPAGEAVPARVPLRLPGGVFDDSIEAAEHLLRAPGAVLVVDGYNVTMTGWPELPAAEQRRRLLAAVSDLAHRTSTPVELVFDGADVEPLSVPAPTRALVRVRFSDPGVEADDVIIDLVGRIPAATPVIVASSDNRVRTGVRRRGANLLHSRQLVDLLRR